MATTTSSTTLPNTLTVNQIGITNDDTPTLYGTGVVGDKITVTFQNQTDLSSLSTIVGADGTWSITLDDTARDGLSDGTYKIKIIETTLKGVNVNLTNETFTIDTVSPKISINALTPTNNNTPTITGNGEAGSKVILNINNETLTTTVGNNGKWSIPIEQHLVDGSYRVIVTAQDLARNISTPVSSVLTIDTVAPTLTINNIVSTNNTTVAITGTGEVGAKIFVKLPDADHDSGIFARIGSDGHWHLPGYTGDGKFVDHATHGWNIPGFGAERGIATTVDATGHWKVTISDQLTDGTYKIVAISEDAAGNISPLVTMTFTVDTVAPLAPIVTQFGTISALNGVDYISNSPTGSTIIKGTAEALSTITIKIDATHTLTTTADATGTWSVSVPCDTAHNANAIPDGIYSNVTVTATDTGRQYKCAISTILIHY